MLAALCIKENVVYGTSEFSKDVIEKFGEDIPFVVEDENLLHPQMGFLACAIEEESPRTSDILSFVESLLVREDLHPEIENAIVISFVELDKFKELSLSIPPRINNILQKWHGDANAT